MRGVLLLIGLLLWTGCASTPGGGQPVSVCDSAQVGVRTGIEVLRRSGFELLRGKRVGLITNPTGVDRDLVSTVDILQAGAQEGGFELVALYGPEHGVRGDAAAGSYVADYKDSRTGLTVFSLYGKTRKPTAGMLRGVDVLVFDIQDIGSRSYTYISTMGLAMEAAAEQGIEFVVLDRPNPLGGLRVNGNERIEAGYASFVSRYPVPYIHGMTVGELAKLFNGELFLTGGVQCELTVVEMAGWRRGMAWAETGLPWVPSSPHIPTPECAAAYPATGIIGELGTLHIGVGYTLPFGLMGAAWITDADGLAGRLNALADTVPDLAGVRFRPVHYKPFYGSARDRELHGVQLYIDARAQGGNLPLVSFYVLQELAAMYPAQKLFEASADRIAMFDRVVGTDRVRRLFIQEGCRVTAAFRRLWEPSPEFLDTRTKYLIYE